MKYFIQVSLITYIASMLVILYGQKLLSQLLIRDGLAVLFICRMDAEIIFYCFFGVRSLPALYLAEITGPALVWHDQYLIIGQLQILPHYCQ